MYNIYSKIAEVEIIMGLPINVSDLLSGKVVESSRVEFKEGFNPDAVIRTICAFANDIDNIGGGYIVLGIAEDNGMIKYPVNGIPKEQADGIQKKLREYCHYIEPLYEPAVELVDVEEKTLIVIRAAGGFGRPYKAPAKVTSAAVRKHYYIRKFSSTVIASPEEERELFYISTNIPFDDRPNLAADIGDMDIGLLRAHLKETDSRMYEDSLNMSLLDIAKNMQLVEGSEESLKPRNVGILMFSEKIENYFRYARIEFVDVPDDTGNGMVEKTFTGPIQRQLKDALAFIKNYVIKEKIIKLNDKAEAQRVFNYPFRAIEEILANAVYHRSYQINEPITVRLEKNRLEVTSHPGFDRSITDEKIAKGDLRAKVYRNRRIGDFLKELRLIEGRNTGFPNARKALKENGSPEFIIEMDPERDYLSVILPVHDLFVEAEPGKSDNQYENNIEEILMDKPMTLTELSRAMNYRSIPAKLSRTVRKMSEEDRLEKRMDNKLVLKK